MARGLVLAIVLVLGALFAVAAGRTPAPQPTSAPITAFSAARAMDDVRKVAEIPHPTGSAQAQGVRAYLIQRLIGLGLSLRIEPGESVRDAGTPEEPSVVGASVENVIGVLPGRDRKLPAVVLMAHSDSVPNSPGAADDGAGVATALETVRALKAAGPHQRDIMVVFTDAEEAGLLGGRLFFADHAAQGRIGAILNLEARGGGGRVSMFETGAGNAGFIRRFAGAVANTNANSLMSEVYKHMPNSTDFTVGRKAGFSGFNFAFLGGEFDYHAASSTPAVLDRGALQHMGDQALALARDLADSPELPTVAGNAVYSDLMGGPVLSYPDWAGWLVLLGAAALAAFAYWRAVRTGPLGWGDMARGAGGLLLMTLSSALALRLAGRALRGGGDLVQYRSLLAQYDLLFAGAAALAVGVTLLVSTALLRGKGRWWVVGASLVAGGACSAFGGFDPIGLGLGVAGAAAAFFILNRPAETWGAWFGFIGVGLLLSLILQLVAPPSAFLTAWPTLIAAAILCGMLLLGEARFVPPRYRMAAGVGLAAVLGLLGFAHLAHLFDQTFVAIGPDAPEALALIVPLAALMLLPLIDGWSASKIGPAWAGLIALAGVGALIAVHVRDPGSVRLPRPVQAFYVADLARHRFFRASTLDPLEGWSRAAVTADGDKPHRTGLEPVTSDKVWLAPAGAISAARPIVTIQANDIPGGRRVSLHIQPQANGRELRLAVRLNTPAKAVTLNGRGVPLLAKAGAWSRLRWEAPANGVTLNFTAPGPGVLELHYAEVADGWPTGVAPPERPKDAMPWGLSDTTVLLDAYRAPW